MNILQKILNHSFPNKMNLLKLISISALILFSSLSKAQNNPLVGKWVTIDGGDSLILELTKNNVFYLISISEEDTIGGLRQYTEEANDGKDSIFLDHKYTYDLGIYPHRLELTAYHANTDSFEYIIPCFFLFREDGSIALVLYDDGIFRDEGDDPDVIKNEFYTNAKINENKFGVTIFKRL